MYITETVQSIILERTAERRYGAGDRRTTMCPLHLVQYVSFSIYTFNVTLNKVRKSNNSTWENVTYHIIGGDVRTNPRISNRTPQTNTECT